MQFRSGTQLHVILRLLALLAAVTMIAAGCNGGDAEDTDVDEGPVDAEESPGDEGAGAATAYQANLESLNDSGVSGTATVETSPDGMVTVNIETTGFVGGNPHAQHFHIGGTNECPGEDAAGDDDLITTAEGIPAYGEVKVALTTDGAVDAASALAVERFPVADEDGSLTYNRSFELPSGVAMEDLSQAVIVQHGFASLGGDETAYDGEMESSLDPSLPLEATIPVACGPLIAS